MLRKALAIVLFSMIICIIVGWNFNRVNERAEFGRDNFNLLHNKKSKGLEIKNYKPTSSYDIARLKAYEWDRGGEIVDWKNAEVTEGKFNPSVAKVVKNNKEGLKGRAVYIVTFKTNNEKILGPITIYLDKLSYEILGTALRD
ncbi:hypothetical protein BJV85_001406 [Clostridium acetobutylicum]|nr:MULTISPECIES: hypothetical protein [Clostridium]ADZ21530.1 Conserved hypothetical protein [Clostridium acetobutylicum EA 2018]NOV88440.1 hypothetical protein [Clostridium acetobutylicum]NOW13216.1 hypothetical protein [Clostridium acetobutylicum]NRY55593.1 hypothetical protein [Clostridium acetobutylicum]NSA92560.1 hypothetical protein [Clostridium acetobutylicum]